MALRIGFLGAGFIADYHAGMLELSGADAAIVAVHDPEAWRADAFAQRHGGVVASSESELIGAVDAVYVCTWTSEHPRLVAAVADAGKAVFCEKPLGVDLTAATQVCATLAATGVVNQAGLVLRDSPAFRLLREWVADPDDGEVLHVVFRDDQYLPVRGQYRSTWRADRDRAGSGTLLEHSIHDLDLLEWIFGDIASVSATTQGRSGHPGIEDVASVAINFGSGATAQLASVWHDVLGRPSQRRVEVFRRRAWYALEGDAFGPVTRLRSTAADVAAADDPAGVEPGAWDRLAADEPEVLEGSTLLDELARREVDLRIPDAGFVDAVTRGVPAHPDVLVALRAHVVAQACYDSAAAGARMEVPAGLPDGFPSPT